MKKKDIRQSSIVRQLMSLTTATGSELAERLNLPHKTIQVVLDRMVRDGIIAVDEQGKTAKDTTYRLEC